MVLGCFVVCVECVCLFGWLVVVLCRVVLRMRLESSSCSSCRCCGEGGGMGVVIF